MRFLKTTIILFLFAVIFSCTNEEEEPFINSTIVGNWELTSMVYTGVSKVSMSGMNNELTFSGEASEIDFTLHFSETPNRFISEGGFLITLTYKIMGEEIKMPVRTDDFMGTGSWEIQGDKLKVTSDGNPTDEMRILKLTDNELVVEGDASRLMAENEGMSTTISAIMTLKR
jgi:hypothetical protein